MKDLKLYSLICVCFLVCTLILNPCVTYASILTASGSNALMTMELDDNLMMMSSRSSLASIKNTVDYSHVKYIVVLVDTETGMQRWDYYYINSDGSLRYYVPDGYVMIGYGFDILKGALPSGGNYRFRVDFSSDVSLDYDDCALNAVYRANNVEQLIVGENHYSGYSQSSGDFYLDETIKFTNPSFLELNIWIDNDLVAGNLFAGSVKFNFASSDSFNLNMSPSGNGFEPDYNSEVSDSLSDISSSVESVEQEVSLVTQAIQTLQGAMEPHYDNVLTQLHHITEQLHAFYDQVYNNIHLPELAKMDEIIDAISNIDIEFQIDFDELKTSINNMSTAVQNKLQSTADQITNGFDNSGMNQDQQLLDDTLTQYEEVENEVISDAKENISGFEFEDGLSEFAGPLADISYLLGALFTGLGAMNVIISFSLTLTIAMCMIGWYRFKGGK